MPGWATVFALEETPEGYKKTTLLDRLGHVSGHWAARVTSDLSKIEGVTDAAKTMQRAARVQVRA